MNRQPPEIIKAIILYIPTHLLYDKCLIDRTWYKVIRSELYNRWEKCELSYKKLCQMYKENIKGMEEEYSKYADDDWDLECLYSGHDDPTFNKIAQEQFEIEENMLKYGMIVDEKEKKKVEYDVKVRKYIVDPWGLIDDIWLTT